MEIDPSEPCDKHTGQFVILAAIDETEKRPYPLVIDKDSGELRVNADFSGDVNVSGEIVDGVDNNIKATVFNKVVPANVFPLATAITLQDVIEHGGEGLIARPLKSLDEYFVADPWLAGLPDRVLPVGILSSIPELLVAMSGNTQLDDGNSAVFDNLKTQHVKRVIGHLMHSFEGEGATLEMRAKDYLCTNGTVVYTRWFREIELNETNECVAIDLEELASFLTVTIVNDTGAIGSYYLYLQGVN